MLDVAESDPGTFLKYHSGLAKYAVLAVKGRDWQTECAVWWGPPGSGKSRAAHFLAGGKPMFIVSPPQSKTSGIWWDGYDGQPYILFDDFYGWHSHNHLLQMIDRYEMRLAIKGGMVQLRARVIIITSNVPPKWWYQSGLRALDRRLVEPIGAVVYMGNDVFPTEESYLNSEYIKQFRPQWVELPSSVNTAVKSLSGAVWFKK